MELLCNLVEYSEAKSICFLKDKKRNLLSLRGHRSIMFFFVLHACRL